MNPALVIGSKCLCWLLLTSCLWLNVVSQLFAQPGVGIGTVVEWGSGQMTTYPEVAGVIAIAAGQGNATLALKSDGTVVGMNTNDPFGRTTVPIGLSGVTAISMGIYNSLAVKTGGTVVAWGASWGTNVPADLSGVKSIATGEFNAVALKTNGTVVAWNLISGNQTTQKK